MIVIVDFDGTLALGTTSRISDRAPNIGLIQRLAQLKNSINPTIKVVTARGSRNGLSESEKRQRYGKDIEAWLLKHNVPYDGLSFNKEYGSIYVDDMTVGPNELFQGETSPFTKNKIVFTETTVIKSTATAASECSWYGLASGVLLVPQVLFCNDELIILERIKDTRPPKWYEVIEVIESMKAACSANRQFATYAANIKMPTYATQKTIAVIESLPEHPATFFHGDLSTTNVLVQAQTGKVYCIDPNYKEVFGSHLTDAGKAYFSYVAYEKDYTQAKRIASHYGKEVVMFAVAEGLRVCKYRPEYISIVNNIADLV
jgi:hypothetical protein